MPRGWWCICSFHFWLLFQVITLSLSYKNLCSLRLTPSFTQNCWCHHLPNQLFSPHSSKTLTLALQSFTSCHFSTPSWVLTSRIVHPFQALWAFTFPPSAILTFIDSLLRASQHLLSSSETASILKPELKSLSSLTTSSYLCFFLCFVTSFDPDILRASNPLIIWIFLC